MPVIKSAKKRMRQNIVRRERNFPVRSEMKTLIKKVLSLAKEGNLDEAVKLMPMAYGIIDKAAKKNIIHENNAARKKSRIARAVNELQAKGGKKSAAPAATKAAPKAKKAPAKKKEEAKAEEVEVKEEEAAE
jgi:small subunit ribosomal protein S20